MKIKFNLEEMLEALGVVSIIPLDPNVKPAGYLFVVREGRCYLYSKGDSCVARASFGLLEVDEEGSFAFPAENIGVFASLAPSSETCELEATVVDDRYVVRYKTVSGVETERTTIDPQLLVASSDEDFEASTVTYDFAAPIVCEALNLAKPFLAEIKSEADNQYKGMQVMDRNRVDPEKGIDYSKGDGYLYACDSNRAFYFYCDAFKGKSLEVYSKYLPYVTGFLSKCKGKVEYREGQNYLYAVAENGNVIGWGHRAKLFERFNYYTLKGDQLVMGVPKTQFLQALYHVQAEKEKDKDKVFFNVDPVRKVIWFEVADQKTKSKGLPVLVKPKDGHELQKLRIGTNVKHFINLVEPVKGNEVELRCFVQPSDGKKFVQDVCLFRTIDEFLLDANGKVTPEPEGAVKCRVTRYMPSMKE